MGEPVDPAAATAPARSTSDGAATMFLAMVVAALPEVIPWADAMNTPELRVVVFATVSLALFSAAALRSTVDAAWAGGALWLVPAAFFVVGRGVDPVIVPDIDAALPHGLAVWLVAGVGVTTSPLWLPLASRPLGAVRRVVARRPRALVVAALSVCLAAIVGTFLRTPAPGIDAWRGVHQRSSGSAVMGPQLTRLLAGTTTFEALDVPPPAEAAFLIGGTATPGTIPVPTSRGTVLVEATQARLDDQTCPMPRSRLAVLLITREDVLLEEALVTRSPLPTCSLVSEGAVPLSRLGLTGGLGAPAEAAHLLAVGFVVALTLLAGSRWARARARWISGLEEARITALSKAGPPTARLASGELVRLTGGGAPPDHRVLLDLPSSAESYRDDARSSTSRWIATTLPRDTLAARLLARAATMDALALLAVVWLSLPALCAWWRGLTLSIW